MAETDSALRRLYDYLPEYVSGIVWVIDLLTVAGLTHTPREARAAIQSLAEVFGPMRLPDIAVGFLLAVFGILVPYAGALALNPFSTRIMNAALRNFYWDQPHRYATEVQLKEAEARLVVIGVPTPKANWPALYMLYLQQVGSAMHTDLERQRQLIFVQGRLTLPSALLAGLATYSTMGQSRFAFVVAFLVILGFWTMSIHFAASGLMRSDDHVLFAFLISTTDQRSPEGWGDSSS